jgi:uncharacterized Zn-binding protein involved in type VI secretion
MQFDTPQASVRLGGCVAANAAGIVSCCVSILPTNGSSCLTSDEVLIIGVASARNGERLACAVRASFD